MKQKVIVVAPHPDDETLGCGGTLLQHADRGDSIHWLIMTAMTAAGGYRKTQEKRRRTEIRQVAKRYGFDSVHNLALPTTRLDIIPISDIVKQIGSVFGKVLPEIVYIPHPGDAHTDHRIVADAASSCTKWFRYPSIRRVLSYETLSETDFGTTVRRLGFVPNVFVDIGETLERKIEILNLYSGELGEFPFPRSETAILALSAVRGAAAGCRAAEAFMLMKEIVR